MSRKLVFGRYDYANFLCFISYAACSVAVPVVLVALAADLGFPLEEGGKGAGGALQLGRSIPMVATMLLCGFAAGHFGKIRSLGMAVLLMGIGILLAAWSPAYLLLFFAIAIAGLGEGVVEGLATPIVQDLHPAEPGRYINFTHSFWSIGVVGTVLAAGALLAMGVSWRWILTCCSLLCLTTAAWYLLPSRKPKPFHEEKLSVATVIAQAKAVVNMRRFWLFFAAMFLAGGGEYCLTFWVASFIQLDYAGSAFLGGLGTAFFAGGMIVGRIAPGIFVKQHKLKTLVVACAAAATLLGLFPPMLQSIWLLLPFLFVLGIATGPFWPSIQTYCVDRMPKQDSTMIYILLSCAGVPGCGVFTALMGVTGDLWGLRESFFLVPSCFAGVGILIFIDTLNHRKEARL